MKFLLDMGLARSTANFLRDRGHDAVHLLARFAEQLEAGALVSVNERAIRARPLPVDDTNS